MNAIASPTIDTLDEYDNTHTDKTAPLPPSSQLEEMAAALSQSEQFQVLRQYQKPAYYNLTDGSETRTGIFLDVETTGLKPQTDRIIQIAIVKFTFGLDGRIFDIVEEFMAFEDPGQLIPSHITHLTGITDNHVRDQRINDLQIIKLMQQADLVIAHNADFDRPFVEKRFPIFAEKAWACSMAEIPWSSERIGSMKQDYIAFKLGFFYDAHWALTDCLAGIEILSKRLPSSDKLALATLLEHARKPSYRIWAQNSPIKRKDDLKQRGYWWNDGADGRLKSWYKDVGHEALSDELKFLDTHIYGKKAGIEPIRITAFERFSRRV